MSYEIRPDYTQQFLLPPNSEDWLKKVESSGYD